MKKLLYSLSIALVAGVAANAAAPKASLQSMKMSSIDSNAKIEKLAAPSAMKLTPVKPKKVKRNGPVTAADLEGTYQWAGTNWLQSVSYPNEGIMTISLDPDSPGKLIIDGFPAGTAYGDEPNRGCYVENGKLYIPNQFVFLSDYYGQEVWFWNYSLENYFLSADDPDNPYGEDLWTYQPVKNDKVPFFFTIMDDGALVAGDLLDENKFKNNEYTNEELLQKTCVGSLMMPDDPSGWFWLCRFIEAEPMEMFSFNEAEWKYMGEALFKDPWFCVFWQDNDSPQYYVPFYCNVVEPNRYLLRDPYGPNTPYTEEFTESDGSKFTINISKEPGYLIFNVTEPECVTFEPFIYAMTFDGSIIRDPGTSYPTQCFNWEGYNYYLNGATYEDLMVYAMQNDMMLSYFDPNDPEGPFLQIYNSLFAFTYDPVNALYWGDVDADGWILFPTDYNGVEDIISDNDEAPAQYFNLQGVRVNNPEKGQLVIVRKGNKATKQVIR